MNDHDCVRMNHRVRTSFLLVHEQEMYMRGFVELGWPLKIASCHASVPLNCKKEKKRGISWKK